MARTNTIVLSDDEMERLEEKRMEMFNTDEVPYGVVVGELIDCVEGGE